MMLSPTTSTSRSRSPSFTISINESDDGFVEKDELLPQSRLLTNFSKRRRLIWFKSPRIQLILIFFSSILILSTYLTSSPSYEKLSSNSFNDEPPYWDPEIPSNPWWKSLIRNNNHIPNIAHFVRQINRDENYNAISPFKVEFRHLMSYYSCHHYLKPEKIYFWTDTPQEMLDEARMNGDIYTKALFRIPNLEIRYTAFPNVTQKGVKIEQYAHRSDFVRTRVMAKMGGQYLDDDAWVLRDLKPLREAGFDNIFSLDWADRIAQAAWLCKPMNPLMVTFAELQEVFFNGDWLRASNDLVTALMKHFSRSPGQKSSLTLEKDAFFQGTWDHDGLARYYEVKDFDPFFREPEFVEGGDVLETFSLDLNWGWRMDWRRSWIVHGFSNEVRLRKEEGLFGIYKGFTPAYILSRRSNIARALYPVLRHMLNIKFLDLNSTELTAPLA